MSSDFCFSLFTFRFGFKTGEWRTNASVWPWPGPTGTRPWQPWCTDLSCPSCPPLLSFLLTSSLLPWASPPPSCPAPPPQTLLRQTSPARCRPPCSCIPPCLSCPRYRQWHPPPPSTPKSPTRVPSRATFCLRLFAPPLPLASAACILRTKMATASALTTKRFLCKFLRLSRAATCSSLTS